MPTAPHSDKDARHGIRAASFASQIAFTILMGAALACSACKKQSALEAAREIEEKPEQRTADKSLPSAERDDKTKSWVGDAVWYDVPNDSLAKRRAGKDELTAAHNRLRLGSMVRVTHLANGKSVIVRITDRGIINRANIDLCKEAAEALGMISEGRARVRLDLLPDDKGVDTADDSPGTAAQP
jgi:rare lipoprotein A